jgi:methylenetetrahydrofolate reductase (NADPH)
MATKRVDAIFREGGRPVSFEIFPPKGELTEEEARKVAEGLAPLEPSFISVTHSAGGSGNGDRTVRVAKLISDEFDVPTVAHLTCQGMKKADLDAAIEAMKKAGIANVLALRGDPRPDLEPGDYAHASDIIGPLREAGFCVGAAAYPEGHVDCMSMADDMKHLRIKQDAGAQFFVTQLFFDNDAAYRFRDRYTAAGIEVPVTFGVMPFMSKSQISRMVFMCGASMPSAVVKLLHRYENDSEALLDAGIEYAGEQLKDLAANGVDGLHIYTMNRPAVAARLVEAIRR